MIAENIKQIRKEIPDHTKLVVVSKKKTIEEIQEAYNTGERFFGENYVQEICAKQAVLPSDIEWHFIGHLQSNKVKQLAKFVHWIHSVDSLKLLNEINKQAAVAGRIIHCLLQLHVAVEETKYGWNHEELITEMQQLNLENYPNVCICGIMSMASFTTDENVLRREFREVMSCFTALKTSVFTNHSEFKVVSMGMSGDWKIAIEEGSTIVRIGSAIFGARN